MAEPKSLSNADSRDSRRRMMKYEDNLRLLNHTLADSPFHERYALFGGLLLGLMRDCRPLPGDFDADFYYLDVFDREFEEATIRLAAAGFQRLYRFRANDKEHWEYAFFKDGAKFEFFRCRREGKNELRYYEFVPMWPPRQQLLRYPDGPLSRFTFLDCVWLMIENFDAGLTMQYGDWRTPDPSWVWHRNPLALKIEPWHYAHQIKWGPDQP